MTEERKLYYNKAVDLVLGFRRRLCGSTEYKKDVKISGRKNKIILKERGEKFDREKILITENFLFSAPLFLITFEDIYDYSFEESVPSKSLRFSDIESIEYSVMPCRCMIWITTKAGLRFTAYNNVPRAETYGDIKDFDRSVKKGTYKIRTLCQVAQLYVFSAMSACNQGEYKIKFAEIERNVQNLIQYYETAKTGAKLYGDSISFDYVRCTYSPERVIQGLDKIASALGEARKERMEELIGSVQKGMERVAERTENERRQAILEHQRKLADYENMQILRKENCLNTEAYVTAKSQVTNAKNTISHSTQKSSVGCENLFDIRDIYLQAPKVAAQIGNTKVAFVFSCPGQKEQVANRVCYGMTGTNLQELISYCNHKRPDVFNSPNKSDYTITNASDRVHYLALTSDTEASYEEIALSENLARLRRDLSHCSLVICMGDRAKYAVLHSSVACRQIDGEHLSAMHLNNAYKSNASTANERRIDRVHQVADKILGQI